MAAETDDVDAAASDEPVIVHYTVVAYPSLAEDDRQIFDGRWFYNIDLGT